MAGLASAFVILHSPYALAEPDREAARQQLDQRRTELQSIEEKAKTLSQDLNQINEERRKINERLVETAALIQSSEGRMSSIEQRLGELEAQEKLLQGSLAQRHGQISKLLSALLRMGRNPPPVVVTKREDALEMVRSALLLGAAFPEMRSQAAALVERLSELVRVMDGIRSEGERLKAETQRLTDARTRLAGLMDQKKQSLSERQAELQQVRRAAADISKSVTDLNELIVKLDQAVTRSDEFRAHEAEIKAQQQAAAAQAAAVPNAAPSDLGAPIPPAGAPDAGGALVSGAPARPTEVAVLSPLPKPTAPSMIELAPAAGATAMLANPGRIKPAIPFQQAKARLPMPVQGRRVISFGEKTNYGGQSKGIVIETRPGGQVVSPADGWIVYAGEFRSYGQLLIINAGGGYHILLAGLSQIDAQPGQFVLAAEPVGVMSGGASARNTNPASSPVLYVEFRHDGRPVDPEPWWGAEHRNVQGSGPEGITGSKKVQG